MKIRQLLSRWFGRAPQKEATPPVIPPAELPLPASSLVDFYSKHPELSYVHKFEPLAYLPPPPDPLEEIIEELSKRPWSSRDPRFDADPRCPACRGTGVTNGMHAPSLAHPVCSQCKGTGIIPFRYRQ